MHTNRLLLILVLPVSLFGGTVRQEYVFTPPLITGGTVTLDGCHPIYQDFAPDIPARSVRLLLPEGEVAVSCEVVCGNQVCVTGRHTVRPRRPGGRNGTNPPADYVSRRAELFSKNSFFPGKVKSEGFELHHKGGHPVFMTQIYPVQYNPVTGELCYYRNMTVLVQTRAASREERLAVVKVSPRLKDQLTRLVDNPAGIAKLAPTPVRPGDYEYLIVTTNALEKPFADFIAFNTRRGMRTRVVTIETIRSSMQGADDQEKIRAYIKKEYAERAINYVLLAGDSDSKTPNKIPHRGLYAEAWDYGNVGSSSDHYSDNIPSDLYYGTLDPPDWKKAGSSKYGEFGSEDKTIEVHVGRFCCDDEKELGNMISKTINYSERPVDSLCMRVLLAGEFSWGKPEHPVDCYGEDELEQLIGTCAVTYGPTVGFPNDGSWYFNKLYWKTKKWEKNDFFAALKTKPAIVLHKGHASTVDLFRMYYGDMKETTFPQSGTPETGNYFFSMSSGCYPGAFDNKYPFSGYTEEDCIAERLTAELSTGAVAVIFNTRFGFGSDGSHGVDATDGSGQRLRRTFWHGVFSLGLHTIGQVNDYSREINADKWTNPVISTNNSYFGQLKWETYQKTVFGDPALSLWTGKPRVLTLNSPPSLMGTKFTVRVPKYSTVALATAGDSIITSQEGDSTGAVTIENDVLTSYLKSHQQGTLKVIVKAHNYFPFSGTVTIGVAGVKPGIGRDAGFSVRISTRAIRYSLGASEEISIELYDTRGVRVMKSVKAAKKPGEYSIPFENLGLSGGMYQYVFTAGERKYTGNAMIVR